jgi:hypothetical protein
MGEPGEGPERELEEGVRRIRGALDRLPAAGREATRADRRLEKRLREEDEASVPHAFVFGAVAAVAAFVGATQPHLFWLLFVALGFGIAAADTLSKVRRRDRRLVEGVPAAAAQRARTGLAGSEAPPLVALPIPAPPESPALAAITERESRIDGICNRLLSELKGAPPLVRELLRRPEETIEALRSASRELARRERSLRAALTDDEEERLDRERAALSARVESTSDGVVRERLSGALAALDAERTHRTQLATAVARIEAEGTRILYSLESLRAQVLRALAADSAASEVTRESLKGGLEALGAEVDAVAKALEEVHGVGSAAPAALSSPGASAAVRAAARQAGST